MTTDTKTETEEFIVLDDAIAHVKHKVMGGHQVSITPVDLGWTVSSPTRAEERVSS